MTPEQALMDAPVQEKTEKPIITKPKISPLDLCYNAIEDYMCRPKTEIRLDLSEEAEKELDSFLASHGFTRDSLNAHYLRNVNYYSTSE